jgi:ribosomal RNA-processing protein 1
MLTIRREWLGIDRLRLDKFMLLIRYFLRQALVKLKRGGWFVLTTPLP